MHERMQQFSPMNADIYTGRCKLENNQDANPTVNTLLKYAKALGMTLSVVLTEET